MNIQNSHQLLDTHDRWRCGETIDWKSLETPATFLSRDHGINANTHGYLFALTSLTSISLSLPITTSLGIDVKTSIACAIAISLVFSNLVYLLTKKTADKLLFQAGALWVQTLEKQGSVNPRKDIHYLVNAALENPANISFNHNKGNSVDIENTVEGVAIARGVNFYNTLDPITITPLNGFQKFCFFLLRGVDSNHANKVK